MDIELLLFCQFPGFMNKRIKKENSERKVGQYDVVLQILKDLARNAHPKIAIINEYCAEYKDLFKEVRNYECFKYLHL